MLGWEFPPYFAGGVGVVCDALTRALARREVEILYLMPYGPREVAAAHLRLLVASRIAPGVQVIPVESGLYPYAGTAALGGSFLLDAPAVDDGGGRRLYGADLLAEVDRFAARAVHVAEELGLAFDVVHAHDWTTFPAGLALRERTGKPLLVHVHITEFDKSGGVHADPRVWAIEKRGMDGADLVVTVSDLMKRRCVDRYFVDPSKLRTVHNGVEHQEPPAGEASPAPAGKRRKTVLFLGRVTLQKGPDRFVEAARRVLDVDPDVTFVLAGTGDLLPRVIERSAELGIGHRMVFAGFVDRAEAMQLYREADLFVMPSVSEPFGIVPLEAMDQGVPVIVSRQSGVAEVVRHALKVDFWDVEDLAAKILAALSYPTLARELERQGTREAARLDWDTVAGRVLELYRSSLVSSPVDSTQPSASAAAWRSHHA